GLPLDQEQTGIAKLALDVTALPTPRNYANGTFICGRRSGKTERLAGNITAFEAVCGNHEAYLAPGERAHIVLVAQDLRAVRVLYRYVLGKFENSDILSQMIDAVRADEIELNNRITISIFPCTFKALRAIGAPCVVFDEIGFYRADGVNVDK